MDLIYLDFNATTPVAPEVAEAMLPFLTGKFGNPSSSHRYGREAKAAVELARRQVAAMLNARPDEIVFTGGGSESNNHALKGVAYAHRAKGNHIITSVIEHPAVSEVCRFLEGEGFSITRVGVDRNGMVDPQEVASAVTGGTILISIMHANNEVGTIQPIEKIGRIARERGVLFHTDAAQSAGKIRIDVNRLGVDLLSLAGHKLYAPKGVGVLYIRRGTRIEKLIHGADHESDRRAGTENVMQIVGLGMAAEIADAFLNASEKEAVSPAENDVGALRDLLHKGIREQVPAVGLNGHPQIRLPNTLSLGFPGVEAAILLGAMPGIAASAGAACHTGSLEPSGVLAAMKVPYEYALGTIRFSLGRSTTREAIEKAVPLIVGAWAACSRNTTSQIPDRISPIAHHPSPIAHHPSQIAPRPSQIAPRPSPIAPSPSPIITVPLANSTDPVRLTEYTHSLGCACKIRPQLLERILKTLPAIADNKILVGHETSDDAAVYRIGGELAIVQTVDFIPPVVDDPYSYGAIAAANALSDVYAMGGKPLFALSIVGFPDARLPIEVLNEILRGAGDKASEAGISIAGGHSIEDQEPKFGLVVTGSVHPDHILRNSGAKPGDLLILTKPIGTGIITTAIKRGLASPETVAKVIRVMAELNRKAAESMTGFTVHACTDVTGFGLLGHLKEMMLGSNTAALIHRAEVPVMDEAWEYAASGMIPGGTRNNLDFVSDLVQWDERIPELEKAILADAQTSGGLLVAIEGRQADQFLELLRKSGVGGAAIIGEVMAGIPAIRVR